MNEKISKLIVIFVCLLFAGTTADAKSKVKTRITQTMYVDRPAGFKGTFDHMAIVGDRLELTGAATCGTYTSGKFKTVDFTKLVGSWSVSYTNADNTVEVEYRIKNTDGDWSGWLSYKPWGFDRKNYPANTTNGNAKIDIDEIMPVKGSANAFQYRVTLRRVNAAASSPEVKAISASLYRSFGQKFNISGIPDSTIYTIGILRQQDVGIGIDSAVDIGGSICSPTTIAMLLQYKGVTDFGGETLPQRYVAKVVRDWTNNRYGNWAYCASALGSWDTTAFIGYVYHVYSTNEIACHLAKVGPLGISVEGPVSGTGTGPETDNKGDVNYTVTGHLMVVRGYKKSGNKITKFYINDPNKGRFYTMTPEQLDNCFPSRIAYVVE